MKTIKTLTAILFLSGLILISCKKTSTTTENSAESVLDYYPLKTGNYWVYETSYYDSSLNFIYKESKNDSILVGPKITINGKEYFQLQHYHYMGTSSPRPYITNVKDSANCIVNEYGAILFSLSKNEITNYFVIDQDTIYIMKSKFISDLNKISLKAGEFKAVNYSSEVEIRENERKRVHILNNLYAKGVGQITKRNVFVGENSWIYQDLVSYKIEK
jgi:hypothetical protein